MFDGEPYRAELRQRVATIRRILETGDPAVPLPDETSISREMRGLAILLLFACYENLLTSICRGLLEKAASLRVGNKRLRTGFRQFAVHNLFVSIANSGENKIWRDAGRNVLNRAFESRSCTIDPNLFPSDGSFMEKSQVSLFCEIFGLNDPGGILREVWVILNTVVKERNNIAHGQMRPEEVGRRYSHDDIRRLVNSWETRWIEFINHVEISAQTRDFYRG